MSDFVIIALLIIFIIIVCFANKRKKKKIDQLKSELLHYEYLLKSFAQKNNLNDVNTENITHEANLLISSLQKSKQDLKSILFLYPELEKLYMSTEKNKEKPKIGVDSVNKKIVDIELLLKTAHKWSNEKEIYEQQKQLRFYESTHSNLKIIPYMAEIMADWESYQIEVYAKQLDWGSSIEREKKVKSIREIRKEAKEIIQKNKEAQYQLAYLLELFPSLEEVIETDYKDIEIINKEDYLHCDDIRDYISNDEWLSLSPTERNQLALDRYIKSHKKTKWQIGRDYELYIGYLCSQKGLSVDFFGSYMGLEDLGRDIIAKKGEKTYIIQCKYWSSVKMIHEKHIAQLYGTTISYCIENNESKKNVKGVLVTNIKLSETAKKFASYLKIKVIENLEAGEYPRIKCNIGYDEFGVETKIYHLPMDQQYDHVKICKKGEFYAMTVKEAEEKGFRRAFKHYSE